MKFIFAAGDVGGARAILPLSYRCRELGYGVFAMRHRALWDEGESNWEWFLPSSLEYMGNKGDVLFFGTSISDDLVLEYVQNAKRRGVVTVHVLDNWSNYSSRLQLKSGEVVEPDAYIVMDNLAKRQAIHEGISSTKLQVLGNPAFESWGQDIKTIKEDDDSIVFVSEPVTADQGSWLSAGGRGYDEKMVAEMFVQSLHLLRQYMPQGTQKQILVFPHPRESFEEVSALWSNLFETRLSNTSEFRLSIVNAAEKQDTFLKSSTVVGMSSILLYRAWLLGKKVISIQPNLRLNALSAIGKREGVFSIESAENGSNAIASSLSTKNVGVARLDRLDWYSKSSERILDFAITLATNMK
jgi:hypothetical protein